MAPPGSTATPKASGKQISKPDEGPWHRLYDITVPECIPKHIDMQLRNLREAELEYEGATVEYLEYRMSEDAFIEFVKNLAWQYKRMYSMGRCYVIYVGGGLIAFRSTSTT